MPQAVDIKAVLADRPALDGRRPETPEEEVNRAFAVLGSLGDARFFAGSFRVDSDWERHNNGDELVHVLDGTTRLTIIADGGPNIFSMKAGMLTVAPQGCWHKFNAANGGTVLTATPQQTDHSSVEDPSLVP